MITAAAAEEAAAASPPRRPAAATAAVLAVPFVLAAIAVNRWFETGRFIAAGDIAPFIRTGFERDLFELWNHRVSGSGSATTVVGHTFEVALLAVTDAVGIPATVAQRLQYGLVVALAVAGAMYLARAVTRAPVAVAAAGVFAVFNPLSTSLLPNPLPLVAVGTAGFLGGLVIRAAAGRRPPAVAVAVALLPASYLALNPPLLALVPLWVLAMAVPAYGIAGGAGLARAARYLAVAAPAAVVVNLWWAVPTGLTLLGTDGGVDSVAVTDVSAWAWTHARASVANVMTLTATWTWGSADYAPWSERLDGPSLAWARYALPALALVAPVVVAGRERRAAASLLPVGLAAILVMKGLHEPLADLNRALYDVVPAFWLFREPVPKIGVALVLVYAVLAGLAVAALEATVRRRRGPGWAAGAAAACVAAPLLAALPLLDGSVIPGARGLFPGAHVRVPEGWHRLANAVNGDPAVDKVLVLPLGEYYQMPTTWGFYGTDATPSQLLTVPVIQRHAGAYFGAPEAFEETVTRTEEALLEGDVESARRLLRDLSATHVVLRYDLDRDFPGRVIADPGRLRRALESMATSSAGFGVARLFSVAPPMRVSLDGPTGEVPLSWTGDGPGEYVVRLPGPATGTLVLREGFSPNWVLTGADARHQRALGYANGWRVTATEGEVVRLSYRPSRTARLAGRASLLGGGALLAALVVSAGRRRRRPSGDRTAGPRRSRWPGRPRPPASARPDRPSVPAGG